VKVIKKEWIELKMKDVNEVKKEKDYAVLNTGSPHYIKWENHVVETDVFKEGKLIRNSPPFVEDGINVNFVEAHLNHLIVRTYERGVEAETYSCGTGVTAAAIASSDERIGYQEKKVQTLGGELKVKFEKQSNNEFKNIWLCGPAKYVYKGTISISD
jgi:diaminopimelate epimerase